MWYFSILALLLVGCGDVIQDPVIDPELRPYYEEFVEIATNKGYYIFPYNINMIFVDKIKRNRDTVGLCVNLVIGRQISIERPYWDKIGLEKRRQLMFHEMGHCILFRGHKSETLPDGCPASTMYKRTLSQRCLDEHADYYDEELFHEQKQ